jgi:uncharacterized membrane protein
LGPKRTITIGTHNRGDPRDRPRTGHTRRGEASLRPALIFFKEGNSLQKRERPEQRNIRAIVAFEKEALYSRSLTDRLSDAITYFSGSMSFVVVHVIWFGVWVIANVGLIPGLAPFDPFPFAFLTLVVSLEAIFLSTFVLMSQNRMSRQADKRAHLDLQVNLLAEQEATMMLQMLRRICQHLGLEPETFDEEVQQLIKETDVHKLVDELEKKLPS